MTDRDPRWYMIVAALTACAAVIMLTGCAYRVVPKARDEVVAREFANIHEAARATEMGVDPSKTCPAIRKACKSGMKAMGYHLEVDDD